MIATSLVQRLLQVVVILMAMINLIVVQPVLSIYSYLIEPWTTPTALLPPKKSNYFRGKVALVTGASSGLGEALALRLAKLGCNLVLASRNVDKLRQVQQRCKDINPDIKSMVWEVDLQEYRGLLIQYQNLIAALRDCGFGDRPVIDILINNAGVSSRASALDSTISAVEKVIHTNLMGPIALTQPVCRDMIANGVSGHVIAISSVQGKLGIPMRSSYAASKHGLQGFFESLNAELRNRGIHTCIVSPGYVQTSLSMNAVCGDGSKYEKMDDTTKSGMKPETLAEKIVDAILSRESEIIVADCKTNLAILAKGFFPELISLMLAKKR